MFKQNVGTVDRALRAIVGLVLISQTVIGLQTVWGWVGLVPLATAFIGWCPAYLPIGLNTCGRKES